MYGPTQTRDKGIFWEKLSALNFAIDFPWCITGDLTELLSPADKLGGLTPSRDRFEFLSHVLTLIHGHSINSIGNSFTWKRSIHTHLIMNVLIEPLLD